MDWIDMHPIAAFLIASGTILAVVLYLIWQSLGKEE